MLLIHRSFRDRRRNCRTRYLVFKAAAGKFVPIIAVVASRDVAPGEELLFDYGDQFFDVSLWSCSVE